MPGSQCPPSCRNLSNATRAKLPSPCDSGCRRGRLHWRVFPADRQDYFRIERSRPSQTPNGSAALGDRIATAERDLANDKTTLDKLIQIARRQGASWAKIGEALGISAQAAHQRAARKTAGPGSGRRQPETRPRG